MILYLIQCCANMAKKNCILPAEAEKLKKAFIEIKSQENGLVDFFTKKTNQDRLDFFKKYVGEEADFVLARLEKTFFKPNQKKAFTDYVYKELYGMKPLYKGVNIKQAKEMAKEINVKQLKNKSKEEVAEILSKYLSESTAITLSNTFERLKMSNNLALFEERLLGTQELRENKELVSNLKKIQSLSYLGALTPESTETFMKSFVEQELGIRVSMEETKTLDKLNQKHDEAFDKAMEKNVWNVTDAENVENYLKAKFELETFVDSLKEDTFSSITNKLIKTRNASLLFDPKSGVNSVLYTIVPSIASYFSLVSAPGTMSRKDISFIERVKMHGKSLKFTKSERKFIREQLKFNSKIYALYDYELSRIENLNETYRFFGEDVSRTFAKRRSDVKGKKSHNKILNAIDWYSKKVSLAPKYLAGLNDMIGGSLIRAITTVKLAREQALLEQTEGKLKEGKSIEQRSEELRNEAYSFNPKPVESAVIRRIAMNMAHQVNNTQSSELLTELTSNLIKQIKINDVDVGRYLVPFSKIATTTISLSVKTATGYGIIKGYVDFKKASKLADPLERNLAYSQATNDIVKHLGLTIAALLFSFVFFEPEDYIPPYSSLKPAELKIAEARGGSGGGYLRVFGKWVPMKFFPGVNVILGGIMQARLSEKKGENAYLGYMEGVASNILELPILRAFDFNKTIGDFMNNPDVGALTKKLKFNSSDTTMSFLRHTLPAFVPNILKGYIQPNNKYDFLGNEVEKKGVLGWLGFGTVKETEVLLELMRLDSKSELPTLSEPTSDYAAELKTKIGEKEYEAYLATLKKEYESSINTLLKKPEYIKASDAEKKKAWNARREAYILNKLKVKNKETK